VEVWGEGPRSRRQMLISSYDWADMHPCPPGYATGYDDDEDHYF